MVCKLYKELKYVILNLWLLLNLKKFPLKENFMRPRSTAVSLVES